MKRNKRKAWRNRLLILILSVLTIWLSIQLFVPSLKLLVISDNIGYLTDYANWSLDDHAKYDKLQEDRYELAKESDIANWIVTSGSTSTGKIVRFAVLVGFVVADCFAIYLIAVLIKISIFDCLRYLFGGGLAQSLMDFRTSIKKIQRERRKAKLKRRSKHLTNNRRAS